MSFTSNQDIAKLNGPKSIYCPVCSKLTARRTYLAYDNTERITPLLNCHHPPHEIPAGFPSDEGFFCEQCFRKLNSVHTLVSVDIAPPTVPTDLSYIETMDNNGSSLSLRPIPYQRKHDGKYILYVNSADGKSLPVSENSHITKRAPYQEQILDGLLLALDTESTIDFAGRYEAHSGPKNHLSFGIDIYVVTNGFIGGQKVPENCIYIVWNEKLFLIRHT